MVTAVYSGLHFLVDFLCAWAMFGRFLAGGGYRQILIYNFCAFALQMPIGALLDLVCARRKNMPRVWAAAGVLVTALGVWTHPAVLGIGNALFHVGGGVGTIHEDQDKGLQGMALGVFVAPGALGLYVGTQIAKGSLSGQTALLALACLTVLGAMLWHLSKSQMLRQRTEGFDGPMLGICCFVVVILRSYVGMAVRFEWKADAVLACVSVLAVVLGKAAGGILAAKVGVRRTITGSLVLAAVCYLCGGLSVFGIGALFFFNMTMPITLDLLARKWRDMPGFAFGLLTFGLFLGFLPVYYGINLPISGAAGSLLSLLLLLLSTKEEWHGSG